MSCSKEYLVSLCIDGQLSEKQGEEVREHLLKCRHCKKVFEEFNKLQKLLDRVEEDVEIVEPTYEESLLATRKILQVVRSSKQHDNIDIEGLPPLVPFPKKEKRNNKKFFYIVSSLAASVVLAVTLSIIFFDKAGMFNPVNVVDINKTLDEVSEIKSSLVVPSSLNNEVVLLPSDSSDELPLHEIQPGVPENNFAQRSLGGDLQKESNINGLSLDYIETNIVKKKDPVESINTVPESSSNRQDIKEFAEVFQVDEEKIKEPVELQVVVSERFYPAELADAGSAVGVSYQEVINEYGEKEHKYDPTGTAQPIPLESGQHIKEFREDIVKIIASENVEGLIIDNQVKDVLLVDIPKRNLKWFMSILKTHGEAKMLLGPKVDSIDDMGELDLNNNDFVRMRITLDISKDF